jgi:flagellar motor switch/type III secretory pathway protein FliN
LNLREGLLKYQKYYQYLLDEKAKVIEDLDKKFAIKFRGENANKEQIELVKAERLKEVEFKFQEVIDLLIENYSTNVSSAIPDPESLPVRVSIKVMDKNMEIKNIQMKQFDCMNDMIRIVEARFEDNNNPVESWGQDVQIYVRGPLVIKPREEEKDVDEWDIDAGMDPDKILGKTIKVENWMITRQKLNIENGSTIEIYGTVKCKSDMPKK